jgi:phosphoserine aminotransferase
MALWSLLGAARPVDMLAWESFGLGWVADVVKQLKLGRPCDQGRLRRASRSLAVNFDPRRGVHLERHHVRRARSGRQLDTGRPQGADHLRRDVGSVRAACSIRQARCGHLLLAEGAWRRGAHGMMILSPRRRAAGKLHAAVAVTENLPADQGRQADRRRLRRRDDQHALDAVRRGLHRRARLGERSAGSRASCARADANFKVLADWAERTPWIDFSPRIRQRAPTRRCA